MKGLPGLIALVYVMEPDAVHETFSAYRVPPAGEPIGTGGLS